MTDHLSSTPIKNISREALHGTFWGYLSFASGKLLNFIATLILARLLIPEQFGLVAYCTVIVQYFDIMNTAGIDSALIARKDKLEEASNAAFVINIIMGIVSFCVAWLIAPKISDYFHVEVITDMFRLLAVVLPLDGLGLVPDALIQRSLRFRTRLIPDITRNIVKGLTSITFALLGWGPWSLIFGQIAGSAISVLLSWMLVDWRPSLKFDWQVGKEMMGYGTHIIIVGFAGMLRTNVDYIIVGKVLGTAALGFYTMAYRIPELAIRSLNDVVGRILFPLLSRTQSDFDALRAFYLSYIRYISLFTFSVGAGLALTSNLFVEKFMSSKWESAVIPMSFIAIAIAIASVGHAPGVLYKSINRPEILTWSSLVKLPFIITLLIFCSRWGINGVAVGQIIFAVFSVGLDSFIVSRIIKIKFIEIANALVPATFSSGIMAAVISLIRIFFSPSGWLGLGVEVIVGVIVFALVLIIVSRETAIQIITTLRKDVISS